jgi:cold shock protein
MKKGVCKWFSNEKGFGFLEQFDGGPDVFVHHTSIEAEGYRSLNEGDHVEFEIENSPRGLKAANVKKV